jgi:hypothetical protein
MAKPSTPRAVKRRGVRFSAKSASVGMRRLLWAVGITMALIVALLFAAGSAVRADTACDSCHTMQPYVEAAPESAHSSLPCSSCHASTGTGGMLVDGLRAAGWVSSGEVQPVAYDDAPCLECHSNVLEETIEAGGIRVRHSDFADMPCTRCHGGTGHEVEGRFYRITEMDDCMQCHRSSTANLETCSVCHVPDADAERREGNTTWRVTHGPGWQQTHGMGDLRTCTACHDPAYCIECHGVRVPHPSDWLVGHGDPLEGVEDERCATCHDSQWCVDCHQVDMPHPAGFLPAHGPEADEVGSERCYRCHDRRNCDECHIRSSHPSLPDVDIGHDPQ